MRVAIYARSAVADLTAISRQIRSCQRFASQNKLMVAKKMVFSDNGFSGAEIDRPGIQRLIIAAIDNQFDSLIVTDLTRLSRKTIHIFRLMELFKIFEINVYLVDEEWTTFGRNITVNIKFPMLIRKGHKQ